MDDKYRQLAQQMIRFVADHAREKNISQYDIADRTRWIHSHVARMEGSKANGPKFMPQLDNFLKYCEAVGVRLELHAEDSKSSSIARNSDTPRFLFALDHVNNELYILHTKYPACLIKVVQTIPVSLLPVDQYDESDNLNEIIEEAFVFYKTYGERMDQN